MSSERFCGAILPKDVVVARNFRELLSCWFLADFECPAPYSIVPSGIYQNGGKVGTVTVEEGGVP